MENFEIKVTTQPHIREVFFVGGWVDLDKETNANSQGIVLVILGNLNPNNMTDTGYQTDMDVRIFPPPQSSERNI